MENDYLEFRGLIKLYIVDDIFWEVFDMASNSNEPIGLRANGAFVVDGYQATLKKQNFEDTQELEEASRNLLIAGCAELESYIQNFDSYADFLSFSQSHRESKLYGYDLMNMLLLINDKKYSEAKSIAEDLISKREFAGLATKGSILTNIS